MTRTKALATVVVSAACFGTLGVLASTAYEGGATPVPLLAARFVLAAALMAAWQAVRDPRALVPRRGDMPRFAALSLTGYGAASLCFFFGVREAGASVTTVLLYTYPSIVALLRRVLAGERLPGRSAIAIGLTFAGCAAIAAPTGGGRVSAAGILLGLGSGVGYALFSVLSYRWMSRRPRPVLMTYMFGFSALLMGAAALVTRTPLSFSTWTASAWVAFTLIVAVPTFAAVLLYLEGMKALGPVPAAIASTVEPVFAIALAAVVLGERLAAVQWAGTALVLGGVVLSELGARPPEEPAVL